MSWHATPTKAPVKLAWPGALASSERMLASNCCGSQRQSLSADKPAGGRDGACARRRANDTEHGRIRHIDDGVAYQHQRVGDGGGNDFSLGTEVWPGEHEVATNAIRDGAEQEIRPEFSPPGVGAV